MGELVSIEEWKTQRKPLLTLTDARAQARTEGTIASAVLEVKHLVNQIPTWGWVAGGLVVVGILAARASRR